MLKDAARNMRQLDRSTATVAVTASCCMDRTHFPVHIGMACRPTVTFHLISHFTAVIWLQSPLIIHNNARPLNEQYTRCT